MLSCKYMTQALHKKACSTVLYFVFQDFKVGKGRVRERQIITRGSQRKVGDGGCVGGGLGCGEIAVEGI